MMTIPLANGNVMKVPLNPINISEEMNKSGVWQDINKDQEKKPHSPTKNKWVSLHCVALAFYVSIDQCCVCSQIRDLKLLCPENHKTGCITQMKRGKLQEPY